LRVRGVVSVLLVALSAAVFAQVREHEFVNYDDRIYVIDNPNLRNAPSWESVAHAFTRAYERNWIPLTWISLQIDYALYGLEPAGYLLTNAALHAASAVLLFLALAAMTGAPWRSAFVAAVFAVHPLHVESVAWASERKDALSGFFWMLTLLAYSRYAERPSSLLRYGLVALCLALGLLAKPMLVTLPFALLLLDYWPLERLRGAVRRRRAVIEKLPMLALAGLAGGVTLAVQHERGAVATGEALPFAYRLMNALDSYVIYAIKSVWPSGLAAFYPHPLRSSSTAQAALSALLLAVVTGAVLRLARRRPYLAVGWLWYLGTLVPVIGLVQVGMQARADRYMYVPLVGLSIMLAWGAGDAVGRTRSAQRTLAAAGALAVALLALAAHQQVRHWRNTTALYQRALAVTTDNFLAHDGLANELLADGRAPEARHHYLEAIRTNPHWASPRIGLGDALSALGEPERAIERYREALAREPRSVRALAQLAKALIETGRAEQAVPLLRQALALGPETNRPLLHAQLGAALAELGRRPEAMRQYETAIALDPDFHDAHTNLGILLLGAGRPADARRHLERALVLGSDAAQVHLALAELAIRRGDARSALRHHLQAGRDVPGWRTTANNLAWLLATAPDASVRDPENAVRLARQAARPGAPREPAQLDTLAAALASAGRLDEAARTAAEAAGLARARGDDRLADEIEVRRDLYRSGRAFVADHPDR
jgi:tetratricopeptide (TPR) repeat protein